MWIMKAEVYSQLVKVFALASSRKYVSREVKNVINQQ